MSQECKIKMTTASLASATVELQRGQVRKENFSSLESMTIQVLMVNKSSQAKVFKTLEVEDKDLIMFTITDQRLEKSSQQVHMVLSLKRKVQTEMLTTYLPTLLLLVITYATTYFKPAYFEASLTVNLTIMLVMTTIFTSKIEELPPTSDTKMIDIWLIFCLLVPFAFTLVQTAIECYREEEIDIEPTLAWTDHADANKVSIVREKNYTKQHSDRRSREENTSQRIR